MARVVREKKRLRQQRLDTREELSSLRRSLEASQSVVQQTQAHIMAAFAKLERIEKMEDHLEERGAQAASELEATEADPPPSALPAEAPTEPVLDPRWSALNIPEEMLFSPVFAGGTGEAVNHSVSSV